MIEELRPVQQPLFDGYEVNSQRFVLRSSRKHVTSLPVDWKDAVTFLGQGRVKDVTFGEDGPENVRIHVVEVIKAELNPRCPDCGSQL